MELLIIQSSKASHRKDKKNLKTIYWGDMNSI
jgi:hypothetical protein